jgi:hypothetical protein
MCCQRLELVGCADEADAGDRRYAFGDFLGEAYRRVEAGAARRSALREFLQAGQRQLDTLDR